MSEHFSTYIFYQGSFVLPGENGGTVRAISGPPNAVGSLGILPSKAGENPVLDKVPSVFQSSGLTSDCHLTRCLHFPGCFISRIYTIIAQSSLLLEVNWSSRLLTLVHPIPFVLLWPLGFACSFGSGERILPTWDRGHKCSIIFWVELRFSSTLVWMWAWTTSSEDPFAW